MKLKGRRRGRDLIWHEPGIFLEWSRKTTKHLKGIVGVPAKIPNKHLPTAKQRHCSWRYFTNQRITMLRVLCY